MKMLGIVAVGVVKESRKYSEHPCRPMGALRGHLCDSTAFLFHFLSNLVEFRREVLQLYTTMLSDFRLSLTIARFRTSFYAVKSSHKIFVKKTAALC